MAETKITDLVPQSTIDELIRLKEEMGLVADQYEKTARELAKGLSVEIKVVGDLDSFMELFNKKTKEVSETMQKQSQIQQQYNTVIANTTNTISRQLMERERLNKLVREEYKDGEKVKGMVEQVAANYTVQTEQLAKYELQLKENKKAQKELEDQYKKGRMSEDEYLTRQGKLIAKYREVNTEKSQLQQLMAVEEKMNNAQAGSYNQMSQQLELLKKTYKDMSAAQKESPMGQEFERAIQDLDAHLKDLSADMGEFQRNVGNYAIAGQNGVVATESVIAAMSQQAVTTQDLADQTKILEEAKTRLNQSDERYPETLAAINAKLEENKVKLSDVSDIMDKDAKSVHEAEEQNKRLAEALKHVDLTSDGAKERVKELNDKIEKNNKVIKENTKSLQEQRKESQALADQLLGLIGINTKFGSSLTSLKTEGKVFDGLKTKTQAFGKTLMGLLSNPWVLTFLGIAGVAAGIKWWYDYNKGLIEASKLTKNFTGETGDAMKHLRSEIQAVADHMGKGFDETIKGANTLVQQFGLKWEEAINLMEDGIAAGADMNGNMLSNIERFAPALRDAGVSAQEFVAILANTKNGIFDEKGVNDILKGGTRLRAMTKQVADSLDAVGISSEKMKKDLEEGNLTMLQGVQKVAQKLKELPENSQEAGNLIKNVFGRTAAEGGMLLLQSLADVDTSLENMKEGMGEWGELQIKQMDAQAELNETIAAVFDAGEAGFESWIAKGKIFLTETLTKLIKGLISCYNWVVDLYNSAIAFRAIVGALKIVFVTLYDICKGYFDMMLEGYKMVINATKGWLMILSGDVKEGWEQMKTSIANGFVNMGKVIVDAGKEIGNDFADGAEEAINSRLTKIDLSNYVSDAGVEHEGNGNGNGNATKGLTSEQKKELEKQAKEQLKVLQQLDESKIAMMTNQHEKEMATIRLNFRKKLEAIKGDGENERILRIQLLEQMEKELEECERKYQEQLAKTNLNNRLASVKKGSKEELDIRLALLEQERVKEIEEAEKNGADISIIESKYLAKRRKLQEDYAKNKADLIMKEYTDEEAIRNLMMNAEMVALQESYVSRLKAAGNNAEEREKIERDYQRRVADIQSNYAKVSAEEAIATIEKILDAEDMSAEVREQWERKLAEVKMDLAKAVADEYEESVKRQQEDDDRLREKRVQNVSQWLQAASEAIGALNDLFGAFFDRQISEIEALQDANEEAGERETERITDLVEKRVITEEEGEARKRAAEAKTARENEKLEKKKADLQYKQAVFQKGVDLAQAAIATALSLMQLWVSPGWPAAIPMMAVVGALGAIQMATIAATPIPKYKEGTPYHFGGPAIVGDGGQAEVVVIGNRAYLTPSEPTVVDLPKGAEVIPSVEMFAMGNTLQPVGVPDTFVTVNNDYSKLEKEVRQVGELIRMQTRAQRRDASERRYELFKLSKGL